jgi:hypothetical protein
VSDQLDALFPASTDIVEAPDLIEPVVAFRKWRVVDGRLRSLYEPIFWLDPMQQAECRAQNRGNPPHEAPRSGCSCGIYASHTPDYEFPTIDYRGVSGIVTAWGNLEVDAEGIRAEWVQVEALSIYEHWAKRQRDAVLAVAESLGSDVIDLYDLEAAVKRYGVRLDPRMVEIDH